MRFLRELHRLFLNLYPKKNREEYADELEAVFSLSLDNALNKGGMEPVETVLREFLSMPKAIIHEHLRERRRAKVTNRFASYFDFANGSWSEFLISLFPFFLVGGMMPLLGYLGRTGIVSGMGGTAILLSLLGILITLLVVGAKKGLPRWSLPYLGFLMSMLSLYIFSAIFGTPIYLLFRNLRDQSILFVDILWDGIFWYGLLFAIFLLVVLSRVSPAFQRFKNDWTLSCFVLYGGVPFAVWITFDEYLGDEPYMFLAFLVLAMGAWFYLRSSNEWTRFGALFAAMTVAILVTAVGKLLLVPSQTWPITIDGGLAMSEFKHTITMWGWYIAGMMIPLANKFLSRSDNSSRMSLSER